MRNEVLSIKRKATIIITMVVMFVVALMGSTSFVSAGEYSSASKTASQLGHKYFKDDWKDYGTFKIKNVVYEFTYGYDTCLINEDYIDDVFLFI